MQLQAIITYTYLFFIDIVFISEMFNENVIKTRDLALNVILNILRHYQIFFNKGLLISLLKRFHFKNTLLRHSTTL